MEEVKTQKILFYNGTYVKDRKYGLVNDYLTYEENPKRDYNIYLEAIKKDCMVIEEVPNNLIGELYLIAEKHGYDIFRLDVLMPRKKLK